MGYLVWLDSLIVIAILIGINASARGHSCYRNNYVMASPIDDSIAPSCEVVIAGALYVAVQVTGSCNP